jgi:hypothetical protein
MAVREISSSVAVAALILSLLIAPASALDAPWSDRPPAAQEARPADEPATTSAPSVLAGGPWRRTDVLQDHPQTEVGLHGPLWVQLAPRLSTSSGEDIRPTLERVHWWAIRGARLASLDRQGPASDTDVRLEGASGGDPPMAEARSAAMDLVDVLDACLCYAVRAIDLDPDEDLSVEYLASDRVWRVLRTIQAAAAEARGYSWFVDALPDDALHGEMRVRVRASIHGSGAAWEIDGACIVTSRTLLLIASRPELAVPVRMTGLDPDRVPAVVETVALTPVDVPARVRLSAPARAARLSFERWWIDERPQPAGQTALDLHLRGDTVATAEYARPGDMNGDGGLSPRDLDLFVLAMADPEEYALRYPDLDRVIRADLNGDGLVDQLDIEPFIELLLQP